MEQSVRSLTRQHRWQLVVDARTRSLPAWANSCIRPIFAIRLAHSSSRCCKPGIEGRSASVNEWDQSHIAAATSSPRWRQDGPLQSHNSSFTTAAIERFQEEGTALLPVQAHIPASFFTSTSITLDDDSVDRSVKEEEEDVCQPADEPDLWLSRFEGDLISSRLRSVYSQIRAGYHDMDILSRELVKKLELSSSKSPPSPSSSGMPHDVSEEQKREEAQLLILTRWAGTTLATLESSPGELALSPSSLAHQRVTMRLYESSITGDTLPLTQISRALISRQRAMLHRLFGLLLSWCPPSLAPSFPSSSSPLTRHEFARRKLLYRSLVSSAKLLMDPRLKRSQTKYLMRKLLVRIRAESSLFRRTRTITALHREKELEKLRKQVWIEVGRTMGNCVDKGAIAVVTSRKEGEKALHNVVRRGAEFETFLTLAADAGMGSVCLNVARHAQLVAHRDEEQIKVRSTSRHQHTGVEVQEDEYDSRSLSRSLSKVVSFSHSSSSGTLAKSMSVRRFHYAGRDTHQAFGDEICLQRVVASLTKRGQAATARKLTFMAPPEQRSTVVLQILMRQWGENVMSSPQGEQQRREAQPEQPILTTSIGSDSTAGRRRRRAHTSTGLLQATSARIYGELMAQRGFCFDRETMEARMASHRRYGNAFLVYDDLKRRCLARKSESIEGETPTLLQGLIGELVRLDDAAQIHAIEAFTRAGKVRQATRLGHQLIEARNKAGLGRQRQQHFQTLTLNVLVRAILFGGARDPMVQTRLAIARRCFRQRRLDLLSSTMKGEARRLQARQLRRLRRKGRTPMLHRITSAMATIQSFGRPNAKTTTLLIDAICHVSSSKLSDIGLLRALQLSYDWSSRGLESVCSDIAELLHEKGRTPLGDEEPKRGTEQTASIDRSKSRKAILLTAKSKKQRLLLAKHCRLVQRSLLKRKSRFLAVHTALIAEELDKSLQS